MSERACRKRILEGEVISDKREKTVTVSVIRKFRHPRYEKLVESRKTYQAHDESDQLKVGQKVRIVETRPLSKTKRWRVLETVGQMSK